MATYDLGRGLSLERRFDAPPDVVFDAWTTPGLLDWFFNPGMPHDEVVTVDLRVGGQWRQHMVVNAETQYMTGGLYREIVPGQKLVFLWGAVGGWPALDLEKPDDCPLCTVELRPEGEGTVMDFRLQLPDHLSAADADAWLTNMGNGWGMTIDRLVAVYPPRAARPRTARAG